MSFETNLFTLLRTAVCGFHKHARAKSKPNYFTTSFISLLLIVLFSFFILFICSSPSWPGETHFRMWTWVKLAAHINSCTRTQEGPLRAEGERRQRTCEDDWRPWTELVSLFVSRRTEHRIRPIRGMDISAPTEVDSIICFFSAVSTVAFLSSVTHYKSKENAVKQQSQEKHKLTNKHWWKSHLNISTTPEESHLLTSAFLSMAVSWINYQLHFTL